MHQTPFVFRKHRVTVPRQESRHRRWIPGVLLALALLLCFLAFAGRFLKVPETFVSFEDSHS